MLPRSQKKTDLPKSNDALASLFVVNARPKRYFYPIGGCIRTYAKFYNPLHFCPAIQQNQKHNFGVESIMFIVILSHIKLWTMLDILLFIILWYRVNGFLMVYHPTSKGLSRIIFSICVESVTGKLSWSAHPKEVVLFPFAYCWNWHSKIFGNLFLR